MSTYHELRWMTKTTQSASRSVARLTSDVHISSGVAPLGAVSAASEPSAEAAAKASSAETSYSQPGATTEAVQAL